MQHVGLQLLLLSRVDPCVGSCSQLESLLLPFPSSLPMPPLSDITPFGSCRAMDLRHAAQQVTYCLTALYVNSSSDVSVAIAFLTFCRM
jgi:hypothetical protein